MTIHYKKNEVRMNLFFGIVWLVMGLFWLMFAWYSPSSLGGYSVLSGMIWLLLSGLYFISYRHQKKKQYLTLEGGMIRQNWPFGKEMKLEEIIRIQNSEGIYLLQTEEQKMKININSIDDESLLALNTELLKLDVEWK